MHFSQIATALALAAMAQCSMALGAASAQTKGCITVENVQGIHAGMTLISKTYNFTFPEEFPEIKFLSGKDPKECVPDSLSTIIATVMAETAKEHDFEKKLVDMKVLNARGTVHAPSLLFKRIRDCPQIQSSAEQKAASTYSCLSAPHPGTCDTCTTLATLNLAAAVTLCGFRETAAESVACCAGAALGFLTEYALVCLER